jgi:hypothetical protein
MKTRKIRLFLVAGVFVLGLSGTASPGPPPSYFFVSPDSVDEEKEAEAAAQLRNMKVFSPEGIWLVEKDFDHQAHWRWQMQMLSDSERPESLYSRK